MKSIGAEFLRPDVFPIVNHMGYSMISNGPKSNFPARIHCINLCAQHIHCVKVSVLI